MITLLLAGAFGGVIRGLMGFLKHRLSYKNVEFNYRYFLTTVGLSAFIGAVVTWAIVASELGLPLINQINPALALIVGYAGGDIIENIYKLLIGKTVLFPTSKT